MNDKIWTACIVALFAASVGGADDKGSAIAPGSPAKVSGLLAYWSLDEGKGETVQDASANRLMATVKGGRWVAGVKGSALEFEKNGEYLDYGAAPQLNFKAGAPFTFAGWVKTKAQRGPVVSQRNSKDGGANIDITISGGKLSGLVRSDGKEFGQQAVVNGPAIDDGQWHHFALTRDDGRTIELFVDGVSQGKATGKDAGGPITTDLRALGSERRWVKTGFPGAQLVGAVDEFCVFDRVLSAAEIRQLAGPRPEVVKKNQPPAEVVKKNQPPEANKPAPRSLMMKAADLSKEFKDDESAATKKYRRQTIIVTGVVDEIFDNKDNNVVVVTLKGCEGGGAIKCMFRDDRAAVLKKVKTDKPATIQGDFSEVFSGLIILEKCRLGDEKK